MLDFFRQGGSVPNHWLRMNNSANKTSSLIKYFMRAYPRRTTAMVGFLILSGLAEGIGILTLLPLLELTVGSGKSAQSTLGQAVGHTFNFFGATPDIVNLLSLIVAGTILKCTFTLVAMKEVGYTVAHVMTELRLQLIRALLAAKWSYFVSQPTGRFANAIGSETVIAARVYQIAAQFISTVMQVLVYGVLILFVSWEIALLGFVVGALVLFVFKGFINITRRAGERQTRLLNSLTIRLTDALNGIKPIKAMAREAQLLPLLEKETQELNESQQHQVWSTEALRILQEPLLVGIIAVGLYFTLSYTSKSFAELMVMVFLFHRLLNRIQVSQQTYQLVAQGESAFWSIHQSILDAEAAKELAVNHGKYVRLANQISFESINFSYGDKVVLEEASLSIPAGQFVAIIGPSGSGKTTIVDLMLGLMSPDRGNIKADEIPLKDINLEGWRKQIGYVPQEMFLFHDSVLKNITLGDKSITTQDVEDALRAAEAWDFVSSLSSGLDTTVGERGTMLSGGQRQRIAIARALVRKPQLLILDEITTALDPVSESAICATLIKMKGKVTIIAVSHQPAVMRAADLTYRLSNGRLENIVFPKIDASDT